MDKTRSQHYNFTHEAMPIMFHSQTKEFITYLEKDGEKFLKFWWDHVGERLDNSKLVPFSGTTFEIRDVPERKSKIYILKLPRPKEYQEFYMMAFVKLPDKRFQVMKLPTTRVFALERIQKNPSQTGTRLVEITPRGRLIEIGDGPEPNVNAFVNAFSKIIWKK